MWKTNFPPESVCTCIAGSEYITLKGLWATFFPDTYRMPWPDGPSSFFSLRILNNEILVFFSFTFQWSFYGANEELESRSEHGQSRLKYPFGNPKDQVCLQYHFVVCSWGGWTCWPSVRVSFGKIRKSSFFQTDGSKQMFALPLAFISVAKPVTEEAGTSVLSCFCPGNWNSNPCLSVWTVRRHHCMQHHVCICKDAGEPSQIF